MKAIAQIKSDGTIIQLSGHDCSLEQAQEYVRSEMPDSLIEFVYIGEDRKYAIVIHEEGLLYELPHNAVASQLAGVSLVGDALVVENEPKDFE